MTKEEQRLRRQFDALGRNVPPSRPVLDRLTGQRHPYVRIAIALILIVGGLAGALPVVGFWMLPLGLLVLALDVRAIRPSVSAAFIRSRRALRLWRRRMARGRSGAGDGE